MSIVERARANLAAPNIREHLSHILFYDSDIQERMLHNFEDSNWEVLDPRLFTVQKMILETAKLLKEIDPVENTQKLQREKMADLALEVAKQQLKEDPEMRAEIAKRAFR